MKLIKQHLLPDALQLCVRVRRAGELCCHGRGEFQLAQRQFQLAVIALRPALRRIGALVPFQVELAGPNRVGVATFLDMPEEFLSRALHDRRQTVEVFFARQAFEMFFARAAAAVADAEQHQAAVRHLLVDKALGGFRQRDGRGGAVIGVFRRHMRQHRRAVDTLPPERMMRVPRHPIP